VGLASFVAGAHLDDNFSSFSELAFGFVDIILGRSSSRSSWGSWAGSAGGAGIAFEYSWRCGQQELRVKS
jgi:hypothetical protein